MSDLERCRACTRVYEVSEMGFPAPGCREPEEVICPHCGSYYTQMTSGVWQTHKVFQEVEDTYNKEHPIKG